MKKLGYMSLDIALPILIYEHGEITPNALFDLVKHKFTKEEFNNAIELMGGWGVIHITFKEDEEGRICRHWRAREDIITLHREHISDVIELLAEGTMKVPVEETVTLKIKTKDIHVERLKRNINTLKYAEIVEEEDT